MGLVGGGGGSTTRHTYEAIVGGLVDGLVLTGKVTRVDFVLGDDPTAVTGALLQLATEIEVSSLPRHLLQIDLRQPTNRRSRQQIALRSRRATLIA